jgi:hypothetical protein
MGKISRNGKVDISLFEMVSKCGVQSREIFVIQYFKFFLGGWQAR